MDKETIHCVCCGFVYEIEPDDELGECPKCLIGACGDKECLEAKKDREDFNEQFLESA